MKVFQSKKFIAFIIVLIMIMQVIVPVAMAVEEIVDVAENNVVGLSYNGFEYTLDEFR